AEALRRQLGLEGSPSGNPAPAPAAPVPAVRHAAAPPAPAPPVPGAPRSPVLFVPPAPVSPIHPTSIPPGSGSVELAPLAPRPARALGRPLARPPHGFPEDGSVCLPIPDDAQSGRWFERVRGTRWTHVVAGGIDLRALAELEPMAVSWVGADVLPGALRFAVELGIPFGWFTPSEESARVLRASPIDIALAVRDLVVRRS